MDKDAQIDLNAAIDRAALCGLLAKALGIPASENESPFADTDDGAVLALAELGVITGYTAEDGTQVFNGEGLLKRSELCAVLYRVMLLSSAEEQPAA